MKKSAFALFTIATAACAIASLLALGVLFNGYISDAERISRLKTDHAGLKRSSIELEGLITNLQAGITQSQLAYSSLTNDLHLQEIEKAKGKRALAELETKRTGVQKQIAALETELSTKGALLQQQAELSKQKKESLEEELSGLEAKRSKELGALQELKQSQDSARTDLAALQQKLGREKTAVQKSQDELARKKEELARKQDAYDSLSEGMQTLRLQAEQLSERNAGLKNELTALKDQKEILAQDIAEKKERIASLAKEQLDLSLAITEKEKEEQIVAGERARLAAAYFSATNRLAMAEEAAATRIEKLTKEQASMQGELDAMRAELNESRAKETLLDEKNKAMEEETRKQEKRLGELKKEVAALGQERDRERVLTETALANSKKEISEKKTEIERLELILKDLDSKIREKRATLKGASK